LFQHIRTGEDDLAAGTGDFDRDALLASPAWHGYDKTLLVSQGRLEAQRQACLTVCERGNHPIAARRLSVVGHTADAAEFDCFSVIGLDRVGICWSDNSKNCRKCNVSVHGFPVLELSSSR